jgi:CO/xanthine dehydrogenase FAD-binding subunit
MIAKDFEFYRPTDISEVLALLGKDLGDIRVLAGGMSLVPAMNLGLVRPDTVISLNHVESLSFVKQLTGQLMLGALVRHRFLETDLRVRAACPLLNEAAGLIADVQVRHRGTIGGSLVHADPSANYAPVMLVLGAKFRLASVAGERWVEAGAFFKGALETALAPGELLSEVDLPVQAKEQSSAYYRLARVHGAFAIANGAAVVNDGISARVSVGGATAKPIIVEERLGDHVSSLEQLLDRVGDAVYEACEDPIEDLFGSAEYRRSMARVVARRALGEAFQRREESEKRARP